MDAMLRVRQTFLIHPTNPLILIILLKKFGGSTIFST